MSKKRRGWFKRLLKWVFLVIALLLAITTLLHATYFKQQYKKAQPNGQLVSVFDGTMHISSMGQGEETIVLLPGMGIGLPSADFGPLMRELSKKYTVVCIEYFGMGFSSQTQRERSSANYVEEIRSALKTAGFTAPYVLMGHSISSLYSEYYAAVYPNEVKAIISLDGTSSAYDAKTPGFVAALLPIAKLQQALGVPSLLGPLVTNRKKPWNWATPKKKLITCCCLPAFRSTIRCSSRWRGEMSLLLRPKLLPIHPKFPTSRSSQDRRMRHPINSYPLHLRNTKWSISRELAHMLSMRCLKGRTSFTRPMWNELPPLWMRC